MDERRCALTANAAKLSVQMHRAKPVSLSHQRTVSYMIYYDLCA